MKKKKTPDSIGQDAVTAENAASPEAEVAAAASTALNATEGAPAQSGVVVNGKVLTLSLIHI